MTCSNEIRVYERMYTKTVIVIESILLTLVLFLAAFDFFQPKFENMQLRNRYSAEDIESMQNYKFDSTASGYVLSTLHSNFNGRIEIPKKFDGEKVVSIADGAFKNFKDIDEIVIPNSIERIGKSAFANCDSLKWITIPDSVTEIVKVDFTSKGAFEDCDSLEGVSVGEGIVALTYHMFAGCDSLKELHLKSTLKEIRDYSFLECKKLETVYYEGTMEQWSNVHIQDYAFDNDVLFVVICEDGSVAYPSQDQQEELK